MKLANAMDIIFASYEEDGVFTTKMAVPIIPSIEYDDADEAAKTGGFRRWLRYVFERSKSFVRRYCAVIQRPLAKAWSAIKTLCLKIWKALKALWAKLLGLAKRLFTRK